MIQPTVLPSGLLSDACRVVNPTRDEVYQLWWVLTYRDGTERRQYEVRGNDLIQTRFGLLPRINVLAIEVMNGAPWDGVRQWRIEVPLGAEAEIHYDGRVVLTSNAEVSRANDGRLVILPGEARVEFRINRCQTYTFGWHLPGEGVGEYLHVSVVGDNATAWADNICFV